MIMIKDVTGFREIQNEKVLAKLEEKMRS